VPRPASGYGAHLLVFRRGFGRAAARLPMAEGRLKCPRSDRHFLVLPSATRHSSGNYALAVSNAGGTTTSSNLPVTVRVPQNLRTINWPGGSGFAMLSTDADGQPLFANDVAGFEIQASA